MKKNKSRQSGRNGSSTTAVHLEYTDPTAAAVGVAGTFNDWRPEATPMIALGDGRWMKELTLPPGVYEYRIVADGEWMADPLAGETKPNPFGGRNSVLKVEGRA
jgi:1,4-alpha-glucan branching enzyme